MFQVAASAVDVQGFSCKSAKYPAAMAASSSKSDVKDRLRAAQRRFLDDVRQQTGRTLTEIAKLGDMHPTTLTRFRNNTGHMGTLAQLTLSMISERTGVPVPADALDRPASVKAPLVLREREAEPYEAEPSDPLTAAVKGFAGGREWIVPWVLRSRALEYEGYRPGDVVMVDMNAKPEPGDVVCAQLYDWQRGRAETVFRLYQPPILIGAGPDEAARRPRFVDDENVSIKGVVSLSFRSRAERASAA